MRKRLLFLLFFVCAFNTLKSQNNKAEVKINSLLVIGIINPSIEVNLANNLSLQLEALGIFYPHGFLGTSEPLTMGSTWLECRYYIKPNHRGFFFAPNCGWGVYRMSKGVYPIIGDNYKGSGKLQYGTSCMIGINIGYKFLLTNKLSLELHISPGYQISSYEGYNSNGTLYVGYNHSGEWLPAYKGGISFGWRL